MEDLVAVASTNRIDWEQRQWELAKDLYIKVFSERWDNADSVIVRKQCTVSAIIQAKEFVEIYKQNFNAFAF